MIVPRLVVVLFLFILIDANPIQQNIRQIGYRQRRSLDDNWRLADTLYHRLYEHDDQQTEDDIRDRRSEVPLELRPVRGPINIEQLPAMLAARYVKRYPYSQHIDPAIIG